MSEKLNLKTLFFAQYWGQKVAKYPKSVSVLKWPVDDAISCGVENRHLELIPLSKISDNHAIEYFDILWHESHKSKSKEFKIEYGKEWANNLLSERFGLIPSNILNGIDYLRSKGYALPFMQYSVADLVNLGWIELSS